MGTASARPIYSLPAPQNTVLKPAVTAVHYQDSHYEVNTPADRPYLANLVILIAAVTPERLKELEVMTEIDAYENRLKQQDPLLIKERKKRKSWDKRVRKHIRRNSIISGMKPDHVLQSWGPPTQIEHLGETTEKWTYQRKDGRHQIILFDQGEVVGWE
ncbi:MAG: hypothetical protein V7739_10790 [Motiliproteus sp.]